MIKVNKRKRKNCGNYRHSNDYFEGGTMEFINEAALKTALLSHFRTNVMLW
jgi:hypothetical protein